MSNAILTPDLIAEAAVLRLALEEAMNDLYADYQAEGRLPKGAQAYLARLSRAHARADRRLQRREFAELDSACGGWGCVDGCGDCS
jgi:hypothetical protein